MSVGILMADVAVVPPRRSGISVGGSFSAMPVVVFRNASTSEPTRLHQEFLKSHIAALVRAYGYRDDFKGTSSPWRVPYLPASFAARMLEFFTARSVGYLNRWNIPEGARQPNLIRNTLQRASDAMRDTEDAPSTVAAKAPALYQSGPESRPDTKVLTAAATWRFFDQLIRLAIHFDVLDGQPGKIDLFVEATGEVVGEYVDKAKQALPGGLTLGTLALVGLGAATLYVVTR